MWVNTGPLDWSKPIVYYKPGTNATAPAKPAILISKNQNYKGDYKENYYVAILYGMNDTGTRDQGQFCDPLGKISGVRCIFNTLENEVPKQVAEITEKVKEQLEAFAASSKDLGAF